jgi:hypothetical protein
MGLTVDQSIEAKGEKMIAAKAKRTKRSKHEVVVNDAPKLHSTFEPGDVAYQGDIIIVAIRSLPKSAKPRINRQLADGSTQGSRHILTHGDVFDADTQEVSDLIEQATGVKIGVQYIGPVFVSQANPTCGDLSHPEHGSQGFPPGAICAVVYQRSLDAEQREARVQD